MENYSPSVIKEFTEKLQDTVNNANNVYVLGFVKILKLRNGLLLDEDIEAILNEMQHQITDNPKNMEQVLGKNFSYFKGFLVMRSLKKIGTAIIEVITKNNEEQKAATPSFKDTITAAAAKKLTENNLDPHAAIAGVEQTILKACAAGKYRAIYEINNPTILARLRNRFGGAGFKTEVLGDNHALALSWD